jgi:hypothetical protein
MKMVSEARKQSTTEERRQDQNYLFRGREYRNKGHKPEMLFWVRVQVKIISVAQNLTTADELKFCVSARGKRNKGHNLKNTPCVRLSMKMISIGRKVRTTEEQHLEQVCFDEEIIGTNAITMTEVPYV